MDVFRTRALFTFTLVFVAAGAHIASHDNILRIQLWDAEGLSKNPTTSPAYTSPIVHKHPGSRKSKVDLDSLYNAMLNEGYGSEDFSKMTRHKARHKRRRPRESGTELPWRFHAGQESLNVDVYDGNVPSEMMDAVGFTETEASAVSDTSVSLPVKEQREVGSPMTLRQDEDRLVEVMNPVGEQTLSIDRVTNEEVKVKKQLPVVSKCCASGQNLSSIPVNGSRICKHSSLTFQPDFYQANETHMWGYDSNVFEIIVDNPCNYDRYKLDPMVNTADEFYLLVNGSLFAPFHQPPLLGAKDFCMETFWNESYPAGLTLPLVCFANPGEEVKKTILLNIYAFGLLISVPFLLATAAVYIFITDLRDTFGKSLACHTIFLALAFTCLAITQLAGHGFPITLCKIMAYVIQYSFISCFFWLNIMCIDILLNITRYVDSLQSRIAMRRRFTYYCIYATSLPLLLLIVTVLMDLSPATASFFKPNFGSKSCWFETDEAALPLFYVPVGLILLANIIMFIITAHIFSRNYNMLRNVNAYELTHTTEEDFRQLHMALSDQNGPHEPVISPPSDKKQRLICLRKTALMSLVLTIIMGVSWLFEVASWLFGAGKSIVSVWLMFDVINALQGVLIFVVFVMQKPVHSRIKFSRLCQKCRRKRNDGSESVVSERTSIEYGVGKRDDV